MKVVQMKTRAKDAVAADRRKSLSAAAAARPRSSVGARPRGQYVECVLEANGERLTYVGQTTHAIPLYGMAGISAAQRAVGVLYGAMFEELHGGGVRCVSLEATARGGSGAGPEGAIDRRLMMRGKVGLAHKGFDVLQPMRPIRAARVAKGAADLGPTRAGQPAQGQVIAAPQPISARAMMDAVCVDGMDLSAVLRAYGYNYNTSNRKRAAAFLEKALGAVLYLWGGEARGTGRKIEGCAAPANFSKCSENVGD